MNNYEVGQILEFVEGDCIGSRMRIQSIDGSVVYGKFVHCSEKMKEKYGSAIEGSFEMDYLDGIVKVVEQTELTRADRIRTMYPKMVDHLAFVPTPIKSCLEK